MNRLVGFRETGSKFNRICSFEVFAIRCNLLQHCRLQLLCVESNRIDRDFVFPKLKDDISESQLSE